MPWPKGKPRSEAHKLAISKGLRGEPKPHNKCVICGRECPKPGRKVRTCGDCKNLDPQTLANKQANGKKPEWRKKVSAATKEAMHRPEVREKHLEALDKVWLNAELGNNFTGSNGQPPNELMSYYASILCPLGYVMDEVTFPTGHGGYWRLDFALAENKINIEIDGSSHNAGKRRLLDVERDEFMRNLGWTVIRIKEY